MTTIKTNDKRTQRPVELGALKPRQMFTMPESSKVLGVIEQGQSYNDQVQCFSLSDFKLVNLGVKEKVCLCCIEITIENKYDELSVKGKK